MLCKGRHVEVSVVVMTMFHVGSSEVRKGHVDVPSEFLKCHLISSKKTARESKLPFGTDGDGMRWMCAFGKNDGDVILRGRYQNGRRRLVRV